MRNRKILKRIAVVFAVIMILGMLMFTLLPLILSSGINASQP
jgi:hypothetical protein